MGSSAAASTWARGRLPRVALAVVVGGLWILWVALLMRTVGDILGGPGQREFDQATWLAWECCDDSSRFYMVDDIRKRLMGASEQEALDLLGPPDWPEARTGRSFPGCPPCLAYQLGLEPALYVRFTRTNLVLHLEDGRVAGITAPRAD